MLRGLRFRAVAAILPAFSMSAQNADIPVFNAWKSPTEVIYSQDYGVPFIESFTFPVVKGKPNRTPLFAEVPLAFPPIKDPRPGLGGGTRIRYQGWFDDRHWASYAGPRTITEADGEHIPIEVFKSTDGMKWESAGVWRQPWFAGAAFTPLDDGRFLALVSGPPRQTADGRKAPEHLAHPYFILEEKHGRLVEVAWMEPGLKKPLFTGTQVRGEPSGKFLNYPNFQYAPGGFVRSGSWIIHVWMPTGLICVFEAKTGRLARTAWIRGPFDEDSLTKGRVGWVVAGYQVRPNGNLILAVREEAAIIAAQSPVLSPLGGSPESDQRAIDRYLREATERMKLYPNIEWWDYDPETGELNRESSPEGAPKKLDSIQALVQFRLRYRADGSLQFLKK